MRCIVQDKLYKIIHYASAINIIQIYDFTHNQNNQSGNWIGITFYMKISYIKRKLYPFIIRRVIVSEIKHSLFINPSSIETTDICGLFLWLYVYGILICQRLTTIQVKLQFKDRFKLIKKFVIGTKRENIYEQLQFFCAEGTTFKFQFFFIKIDFESLSILH